MIRHALRSSSARYISAFTAGTLLGTSIASVTHSQGCPVCVATPELKVHSKLSSFCDLMVGLARFIDCGIAFARVAADYKISLFFVDPNGVDYYPLKSKIHERSAICLREMCCRNGGVFIKAAQHIGSLDYLLPIEYVNVMRVLHSDAPTSSIQDVRQVIEEELGQPLESFFTDFEPAPCGAASLAQAHKARLRSTGELVVVKVQHKNVKKFAFVDMKTMEFLVKIAEKMFPEFRFRFLVEATKENTPKELDFLLEADNCESAEKTYKHLSHVIKFPKIYRDVSTSRVLTMEFCHGCQVDDLAFMKKNDINPKVVVCLLGKLYSDMIFTRGLMHCDPHPGNLLVQKHPLTGRIKLVLLDHGLYQQLTEEFRLQYCRLWLGLISGDVAAIQRAADEMGTPESAELFACIVAGRSWKSVIKGEMAVTKKSLEEESEIANMAVQVVYELTGVLDTIPRQLLLILKTNDLIRGIQTKLRVSSDLSAFMAQSRACFWALARADFRNCSTVTSPSRWQRFMCRIKVIASLLIRLLHIKFVEYSFAFTSHLYSRKWLKTNPQQWVRQLRAA